MPSEWDIAADDGAPHGPSGADRQLAYGGAVHGDGIVPGDEVADPPVVVVAEAVLQAVFEQFIQQNPAVGLGKAERLGKMFSRTLLYYVSTSLLAIVTGLAMVNLIDPGGGRSAEEKPVAEKKQVE